MARLGRGKDSKDAKDESVSEVEVSDLISADSTSEFGEEDDAFANFLAATVKEDDVSEQANESTDEDTEDTNDSTNEEEVSEMTATHEEVAPEAEVTSPEANDDMESALSEAAKEIADKATGHTVEMLDINSIPPTALIVSANLRTLDMVADQLKRATEEFRVGTSGQNEKIKHAIANLSASDDPENFARVQAIKEAEDRIAELEDLLETTKTQLWDSVENRLAKDGNVIWSPETVEAKKNAIQEQYGAYQQMFKATESFVNSHRSHTPADNVGTIDQYHVKLSKPFAKTGGGSGTRQSSGAPRNVSVTSAEVSYDGGTTWHRAEGTLTKDPDAPVLSNPSFLAAEIARISSESGGVIKTRIYTEWYGANGSADGTPLESDAMQEVTSFPLNYKTKDGADATALVKLTKKMAAIEA